MTGTMLQKMAHEDINFEMFQDEQISPRMFRLFSSIKYGPLDYQYNQYLHWGTTVLTDPQLCDIYQQVLQQFPISSQQPQQYMEGFIDQLILKNHGKKFDLVRKKVPHQLNDNSAKLIKNFNLLLPDLESIRAKVILFTEYLQKYFPVSEPHEPLEHIIGTLNREPEKQLVSKEVAHLGVVLVICRLTDLFYDESIQCQYIGTIQGQAKLDQEMAALFKETINMCVDQITYENGANLLTIQFLLLVRTYSEYGYYKLTDNQVVEMLITGLSKKMGIHHLHKIPRIEKILRYINCPEIYLPWIVSHDYKLIPKDPSIPASRVDQLDYAKKDPSPIDSSLIPLDLNNRLTVILKTIQNLVLSTIQPLKVWRLIGEMMDQLRDTFLQQFPGDLSAWNLIGLEKVLVVYHTLIDHNNNLIVHYGKTPNSKELRDVVMKFNLSLIYNKLLPLVQKTIARSSTLAANAYAKVTNSVLLFNYIMVKQWNLVPQGCLIFQVNEKLVEVLELNQQFFSTYTFFQIHGEFNRRIRQQAASFPERPEDYYHQLINQKCNLALNGHKEELTEECIKDALRQFLTK